jgi:DNA repair protein RecN (Recombination protein N)
VVIYYYCPIFGTFYNSMLISLKIKNFIIIESISINFSNKFSVITGETGAGKSILIDAIKLVLGGRASTDTIRHGQKETELEAVFNIDKNKYIKNLLKENSIESEDSELIVRRIINDKGQSKIFINDNSVTLTLLSRITPLLVDICSQFENQSLFSSQYQLDLIDKFSKNEDKVVEFKEVYKDLQSIQSQLKDIESKSEDRESKIEYYQYQFNEIKALKLEEDEEQKLENELDQLDAVKDILELSNFAEDIFYGENGSVLSQLETLKAKSAKVKLDGFQDHLDKVNKILELAEELGLEFDRLKKNSRFNPKRRDEIYTRLDSIKKVKKKYGGSVDSVVVKFKELKDWISELENLEKNKKDLVKKQSLLLVKAKEIGVGLNQQRVSASGVVSDKITKELQDLNMKGAQLKIEIIHNLELINSSGFDTIKIHFAPNKGEPFGLLEKIASGGELSRITLAIHKVLTDSISKTYIFDEVDTGIGGDTGKVVGKKLKEISTNNQVVCITHLAQVAIFGDKHCLLEKEEKNDRVVTSLKEIKSKDERVEEVARMLSGNKKQKEALAHAESLLKEGS